MFEAEFFEIAFYRITHEAWLDDVTRRVSTRVAAALAAYPDPEAERPRQMILAEQIERPHPWQYNEVVGWVRLLWDGPGPVIKGYLSRVGRERYRRGFRPYPFGLGYPINKVLEVWLAANASDTEIYRRLRAELLGLTRSDGPLPGRSADLRSFDAIAPYVQWRELIQLPD